MNRGDVVKLTGEAGTTVIMRVCEPPEMHAEKPVVWLCSEQEWDDMNRTGFAAPALPWPVEAIGAGLALPVS